MIHLSLPPPPDGVEYDGYEEAEMPVRADLARGVVELTIPGQLEIVLSITATIALIRHLRGALARLSRARGAS
jgi:hypothetical protein